MKKEYETVIGLEVHVELAAAPPNLEQNQILIPARFVPVCRVLCRF